MFTNRVVVDTKLSNYYHESISKFKLVKSEEHYNQLKIAKSIKKDEIQ